MAPRTIAIQPLPNAMITDPQRLTVTQPWRLYFQSITDAISALTFDPSGVPFISGAVFGPATATPNAIALFDDATGKLIKDSGVLLTSIQFKPITLADLPTGAAGTVLAGGSPPFYTANPVVTTITVPTVIGGTGTASTLTLKATSGVGATDAILFAVGNNGATEALRVTNAGFVGIGTIIPSGALHVFGTTGPSSSLFFERSQAVPGGPNFQFFKSRAGAIVQADDSLGQFLFQGWDGTVQRTGASIRAEVDGTPGASDMPGRLVFATSTDGSAGNSERLRINNAGLVQFGGPTSGSPALKRNGAALNVRLADDSADASLTAATAAPGTNTTQVATTAFVTAAVAASPSGDVIGPASATNNGIVLFNGTTGKLIQNSAVLVTSLAPLASPTFTGTPAAPTATFGTNTTQIATTAFVQSAVLPPATNLTDGATVALDAARRAPYYRLVANGDRTISAPTGPTDGQRIIIEHLANAAPRTLTLAGGAGGFTFGSTIPALTITVGNKADYITALYDGGVNLWVVISYVKGYF